MRGQRNSIQRFLPAATLLILPSAVLAVAVKTPTPASGAPPAPVASNPTSKSYSAVTDSSPSIRVDYRADDASRLRRAGLLVGPLSLDRTGGGVAGVGCSFDIECDDGNPCTRDDCNFQSGQPAGSGTCTNTPVTDGTDGAVGNSQCPANFGLACGGCNDGAFCNGIETCQGGACVPGSSPCTGGQVCSESFRMCQNQPCVDGTSCSQPHLMGAAFAAMAALQCNGVETCDAGVCVAGANPCGSGGLCGERRCSIANNPNFPLAQNIFCMTDEDCAGFANSACTVAGPACREGRCCVEGADPLCSRRFKAMGRCLAGVNPQAPCASDAHCAGGTCNFAETCDSHGGLWYGHDAGTIPANGPFACPVISGVEVKCPRYSAGIAPVSADSQLLGPVSESPAMNPLFGVPLQKLGDDYTLSNSGVCASGAREGLGCGDNADCPDGACNLAGSSFILLDRMRFAGGSPVTDRISFEFYDQAGFLIEDVFYSSAAALGVNTIWLSPPLLIPSKGFVVMRTATAFSPNARHVWASTDGVDVGNNDPEVLWINDGPAGNFGSSGVLTYELEGQETTGPFGACCDRQSAACTDGVLPWVCEGQGNYFQGIGSTCLTSDCSTGACCHPLTGTCSEESGPLCQGSGGEFLGYGSSCDADGGQDGASQHCCPQPQYTGADRCEDAVVHAISVPPAGDSPAVVTITGDNSTATFHFEDYCCPPNVECPVDLGWWEAFEIDREAYLRIDLCCSDPVRYPANTFLFSSCPCGQRIQPAVHPLRFDEPSSARGGPYCAEENSWMNFGPLPPGRYYYPVNSVVGGVFGPYQIHITVDPVLTAACCLGDQCVENLTVTECDDLGGIFAGPPNRFPAVPDCSSEPCATGSCCVGPGQCLDTFQNNPMTLTQCDSQSGNYLGGVRCKGGSCSTSGGSCSQTGDCPGGQSCVGTPQQLAQPLPCPICEIEGADNCQRFEAEAFSFALSDRHLGFLGIVGADDFVPGGDTISTICVWGFYLDGDPDVPVTDCGPLVLSDHFRVRLFDNDPITGRMPSPGSPLAETLAISQRGIIPGTVVEAYLGSDVYAFQLTLNNPMTGLTPGQVYWLEVSNDVSDYRPTCNWFWMQPAPGPGSYSFSGNELGYTPGSELAADQAFCLDVDFTPSAAGSSEGPCCLCTDGSCSQVTLHDCEVDGGEWDLTRTSCEGVSCTMPPPNDFCADGPPPVTAGVHLVNNSCATTDGYNPIPSEYGPGSEIESDLWYYFVAPGECPLTVSECQTGFAFDSILAVYHNPDSPTICPPCPLDEGTSAATLAGVAQDDSCIPTVGGAGRWMSQEQLGRNALPGECFLIRVGSFPGGGSGVGTLDISCAFEPSIDQVVADTVNKSRFISFRVPGNNGCTGSATPFPCCTGAGQGNCNLIGSTAIRIVLSSLHVVAPPYTGGPSNPFTAFAGEYVYVGPPGDYVESPNSGIPFKGSHTQCTPHYRDWNTVGLLHVTGAHVVPSSTYRVDRLGAACNGFEGTASCLPGGAYTSNSVEIQTTRWADVEAPYNPPDATAQPNASDIAALVLKFRGGLGAPIKARALLAGTNIFGEINIAPDLSFQHIAACVDAFRGLPYPYKMGRCAIGEAPCSMASDCQAPNEGPCQLYCP